METLASPFHQKLLFHGEPVLLTFFFLTTFNSSIFTHDMKVSLQILK